MSETEMNDPLAAVEAALRSLRPSPSGLDRDRLMFLAGQRALGNRPVRRRRRGPSWLWPCTTAASMLLAVTLGSMLLVQGKPEVGEPATYVHVDTSAATTAKRSDVLPAADAKDFQVALGARRPRSDYLKLRQQLLAHGVDALPKPFCSPVAPAKVPRWGSTRNGELEQLLGG